VITYQVYATHALFALALIKEEIEARKVDAVCRW